jgi:hypothetical protein
VARFRRASRGLENGFAGVAECFVRNGLAHPPSMSSSSSGGNPLATWRTIAMISCTISPRAPLVPHRGADLRLGVVRIHKLPIVLI